MPAELFSFTGDDVAIRVRSQFGDFSGAQLSDFALLSWINDGQREIVNNNLLLRDTKISNIVKGQQEYSFPDDKVLAIEALYVDGYPVDYLTPQAAREYILKSDPKKEYTSDRPEIYYERAGIITFYPTPNKDIANGLKLEYLKVPAQLAALSDTLSVPDRYFNELVNYVMAQSLEADENYDAAAYKLSQFRDGLDRLESFQHDRANVSAYPQMMPDPDDYYY